MGETRRPIGLFYGNLCRFHRRRSEHDHFELERSHQRHLVRLIVIEATLSSEKERERNKRHRSRDRKERENLSVQIILAVDQSPSSKEERRGGVSVSLFFFKKSKVFFSQTRFMK